MKHAKIIELWGGYNKIAQDLGVTPGQARKWWERDSIPAPYWKLVESGSEAATGRKIAVEQLLEHISL